MNFVVMKRLFFVSVVAAAVLVSFASCGDGESSETPEERKEAFKNLYESMKCKIGKVKFSILHQYVYSISELKAISAALEDDGDITYGELSPDLIYKIKANGDGKYVLFQGRL